MRILFSAAAPWCNGSYGKPLRSVLPLLHEAGHELAVACFYGFMGAVLDTHIASVPVRLYPAVRDTRLNDIIQQHSEEFEADCVISFQDVWVCEGWGYPKGFTWIPWMPVDTSPVTPRIKQALEGSFVPMVYSQWGTDELVAAGWPTAKYVPLGVDLDVYKPQPQTLARQTLGIPDVPFIAGMVAGNASLPPRKCFPEVLQAWKRYLDGGGDGLLYIHTTLTPTRQDGFDFALALEQLGLKWSTLNDPDDARWEGAQVIFPNQYRMFCHAIEDDELSLIYNAMDVLLSPSQAEGFGLPILEAQACGKPVVTLNVTSMPEITFAGLCIEPVQPVWEPLGGWRGVAPIDGILEAIIWAREMADATEGSKYLAEKARAGAEDFAWAHAVNEHLLPVLEELA